MSTTRDGSGLRKRQQSGFAAVPNKTVWDDELPTRALGVLTKLIALPVDWKLDRDWLVSKCGGDGREAVMTALRHLRRLGYYRVERRRVAGGTFVTGVSVSDVRVPEWAAQHAAACRDQGTDKPRWDVTLRLLDDGRVEDEPARGPVDEPAGGTGNGFPVTGDGDGAPVTGFPSPVNPVTGNPAVREQTDSQTDTPLPSVGGPQPDVEQLHLVGEDGTPEPRRPRRRTRIPEDWRPSPELLAKAAQKVPGVDVEAEARKFHDYHRGVGRPGLDWDLAFIGTWMTNVAERQTRRRPGSRPYRDPQRTTQQDPQQQLDSTTSDPGASDSWDDFLTGGRP